jgi:GntR family transcriptional regulator
MRLQRESPDPLYLQLKSSLVDAIKAGRYQPHQRLPSERELSDTFQVSRMTVRQALIDLVRDGAIYTRVGKGTFVAEPKIEQQLRAVTGFSQDVRTRGGKPASYVLEAKVAPAAPEIGAALRLSSQAQVVMLSRIRLSDGMPLAIETAYLPHALFPDLLRHDFSAESLYDVLEHSYKLRLLQAEQTIEAALATLRESELLQIMPPAAVLKMQRVTQTSDGVLVEYVESAYRGDRYKFHSTLQPGAGAP